MKRHAWTIALLLIAVGLSVFLWRDRDKVSDSEREARAKNAFSAWRGEDLTRIDIARDGELLVLVRDGDRWKMTSPHTERADQAAIDRLTTTLEFATVVRKVAGDATPTELAFDTPRASGSITMGALVYRFVLGGVSPRPEGSSYFRVDGGAPFVVSKEVTDTLLAPSDKYRDRTVVPYLSTDLARLEVTRPGGGFSIDRTDDRSFTVGGLGLVASRSALDKVWAALAEMRAESFPKDDAERLTAHPGLTLTLIPKGPSPKSEIVTGDACPGQPNDVVVLRRTPTRLAACAPKGAIDALLALTPDALLDRCPFSFRPDEIEEIRFERLDAPDAGAGARVLELARRGNGFHEREPVDRQLEEIETDAANEVLSRIDATTASEILPKGSDRPFAAIARVRVRAGDREETVEVGPLPAASSKALVHLRRVRDDAELLVPPDAARRLLPRATATRPLFLLHEERRVTEVHLRCGTAQDLVDDGSGLKLTSPSGYATDGLITQLVDGLVRGKVVAWVADADDGRFGLRSPDEDCRVVLSFADGKAPTTVRFGAEAEGGVYGIVSGRPEVFLAPLGLESLVKRVYVDRAALRVDPSDIDAVTVTRTGKPVAGDIAGRRIAMGRLNADHAVSLDARDVGAVDIAITVRTADGGPTKRIVCGVETTSATGRFRRCATSDVRATFEVRASLVNALVATGTTKEDAGP